jgi:hypothetical protein
VMGQSKWALKKTKQERLKKNKIKIKIKNK